MTQARTIINPYSGYHPHAQFSIMLAQSDEGKLTIYDKGPWDQYPTITNDAEYVVQYLHDNGHLPPGRRLFYYDSENQYAELVHRDGVFVGFAHAVREARTR